MPRRRGAKPRRRPMFTDVSIETRDRHQRDLRCAARRATRRQPARPTTSPPCSFRDVRQGRVPHDAGASHPPVQRACPPPPEATLQRRRGRATGTTADTSPTRRVDPQVDPAGVGTNWSRLRGSGRCDLRIGPAGRRGQRPVSRVVPTLSVVALLLRDRRGLRRRIERACRAEDLARPGMGAMVMPTVGAR
jgi:hypothetical protein